MNQIIARLQLAGEIDTADRVSQIIEAANRAVEKRAITLERYWDVLEEVRASVEAIGVAEQP